MNSIFKALSSDRKFRHKIMLMLLVIAVVRIISTIPVPGIDASVFKQWINQNGNDAFSLFSAFTGGSFENFSIMALGITPYITASIVIQLLEVAIPSMAKMQRDGESGRRQLERITIVFGAVLALVQSIAISIGFGKNGMIADMTFIKGMITTISLTGGACLSIYFAKLLTDKSIGNGTSVLLVINIISRIPAEIMGLHKQFVSGKAVWKAALAIVIIIALVVFTIMYIAAMDGGVRTIPVQYSRKMSMQGSASEVGSIPVKVGILNVMPVIFASSLFAFPQLIAAITGKGYGSGLSKIFLEAVNQSNWFNPSKPIYTLGAVFYLVLMALMAYFYAPIALNPAEVAESIRKQGGVIPGVRLGKETERYIERVSYSMAFVGTVMLTVVVLIPMILTGVFGVSSALGGTSIIIIVGVQIEMAGQLALEAKQPLENKLIYKKGEV